MAEQWPYANVGGESKTNESETKYYYPTDNLDFEETNFTTSKVKPIATPTPIPSGELSAMLAELSSMENTSDSEYASEGNWASTLKISHPILKNLPPTNFRLKKSKL